MQVIQVTGSDDRLDGDSHGDPVNPLPVACKDCGFPDLDFIPKPYEISKSRAKTTNELVLAAYGNLLARERARRVIELVVPGQCSFHPVVIRRTHEPSEWFLVVPSCVASTGRVSPKIRCCSACGEPKSAHPGTQYAERSVQSTSDFAKAVNWQSSEKSWDVWLDRSVVVSVRFYQLLKKIGLKGIDEATCQGATKPDRDDLEWIAATMTRLSEADIPLLQAGTLSAEDSRWFKQLLKSLSAGDAFDFKSFEKQHRLRLPKSYKDFIGRAAARRIENVDGEPGNSVEILTPGSLDLSSYRHGVIEATDEESGNVDGVMFASTNHGDCYCFDLATEQAEPPVVLFRHEGGFFEPYTDNFVQFVRRASERS